jgi:hypothetical protein
MLKKKYFILIILCCCIQTHVYAGFPIGKYRHSIVVSYIYGSASRYWDSTGNLKVFSNKGTFTSNFFSLYIAYGLTRKTDIFINLPYLSNSYTETNLAKSNATFGDAVVGFTYYIEHFDYSKYLSFTASFIAPMYTNNIQPYAGYGQFGVEGKFNYSGYSKGGALKNTFYDIQVGARRYNYELGPTQIFADVMFGTPVGYKTNLNAQVDWFKSFSNDKAFNAIDLQLGRDFTFVKLGANLSYRISPNVSYYINAYTFVSGVNTGKSQGASISAIFKF